MFKNKSPRPNRRVIINVNEAPRRGGASAPKLLAKSVLLLSIIAGVILIIFLTIEGLGSLILHYKKTSLTKNSAFASSNQEKSSRNSEKKSNELLEQIKTLAPDETYILIDTAKNILLLKQGDKLVRQVVVSTGSGNVLTEPTGRKRTWTFDTPRGEFAIKSMSKDPKWTAPDWEFISNGEPIPRNREDRIQEGVLGDYKLGIGNDIYIHGTIYTRTMGMHVTHGCIRVGDNDLLAIWKASKIGTKVFIF
jgi:L,D-transpeptidase ErfK/SrfK